MAAVATIFHSVSSEPPSISQGTRICGFFALNPPFNAGSIMVFRRPFVFRPGWLRFVRTRIGSDSSFAPRADDQ
jgi:hypothetical protein